jgi:hypothetical protein
MIEYLALNAEPASRVQANTHRDSAGATRGLLWFQLDCGSHSNGASHFVATEKALTKIPRKRSTPGLWRASARA